MKYLAQDCSLYEATQPDKLTQVNEFSETIVSCLQSIIKTASQVILNRSSLPSEDANRMLETAQNPTVMRDSLRDKLLDVENRLKSKFAHVSKLEASLEKVLKTDKEMTQ